MRSPRLETRRPKEGPSPSEHLGSFAPSNADDGPVRVSRPDGTATSRSRRFRCLLAAFSVLVVGSFAAPAHSEEPLPVEFVTVEKAAVSETISITGEIVARNEARAGFREGGRVNRVAVEEGDRVKAGQTLAEIDNTQQREGLNAAEARLAAARATLAQARNDDRRQASLLERGFTTRADRDQARDTLDSAEAAAAEAVAELEQAKTALDDTVLSSPINAVVTGKMVEPGQVVAGAEAAFTLAPVGELDALFNVPDSLIVDPLSDQDIDLQLIDQPEIAMEGRLREISPLINPQTGAVAVYMAVRDPPPAVQIGAPVRGVFTLPSRPVVRLPWTALSANAEGPAIWVVGKDNTAVLKNIEIGRYESGTFTVAAGLEIGDRVVGDGASFLYPGRPVVPAEGGE